MVTVKTEWERLKKIIIELKY